MTEAKRQPGIWTAAFIALVVVNLSSTMGQFTAMTVIPLYARELGAAASIIGFIGGCFGITALAIRPFAGPAFDSFSKRKILILAYVVATVATLGYAVAQSVPMLIASRLLHGIGGGCIGPLSMALVSEALPRERLSSGIGYYSIATAVSQAFGPAFGIELSRIVGYQITFVVASVLMGLGAVFMVIFVKEPKNPQRPPYQIRLNRIFAKQAIVPAIIVGLLSVSISCTGSFMAIYGGLRGVDQIGLYFTVYAICLLFTRPLFGRLSDKYGTGKVLLPAMVLFVASYVLVSQATNLPMFLAASVIAGGGFGAALPLINALVFKIVPREFRGAGSNTSYTGMDVGMLIGPYAGGLVIEALIPVLGSEVAAYSTMWIVMTIPIIIGIVFFISQSRKLAAYEEAINEQEAQRLKRVAAEAEGE